MDIRPSTGNAGLTPTPDASGAGAAGAAAEAVLRAASGLDLAALASQWASSVAQARSGGDGVTNANGKPAITPPSREFSAAEMVDLLRALQGKTQDAQLRSAKENIENNRIEQAKNNEEQARKVDEWIQKSKEAEKGGILGKITEVSEQFVTLEIAPGVHIKVQRHAVSQELPKGTLKSA